VANNDKLLEHSALKAWGNKESRTPKSRHFLQTLSLSATAQGTPYNQRLHCGGVKHGGLKWRAQTAASYVDRILRGDKPADLPVQAPTRFETTVNLKTRESNGSNRPVRLAGRRRRADRIKTECPLSAT